MYTCCRCIEFSNCAGASRPRFRSVPVKKLFRPFQIWAVTADANGSCSGYRDRGVSSDRADDEEKLHRGGHDRDDVEIAAGDQRELSRGTYPGARCCVLLTLKNRRTNLFDGTRIRDCVWSTDKCENYGIQRTQWRNCFADRRGGASASCPTRINLAWPVLKRWLPRRISPCRTVRFQKASETMTISACRIRKIIAPLESRPRNKANISSPPFVDSPPYRDHRIRFTSKSINAVRAPVRPR